MQFILAWEILLKTLSPWFFDPMKALQLNVDSLVLCGYNLDVSVDEHEDTELSGSKHSNLNLEFLLNSNSLLN